MRSIWIALIAVALLAGSASGASTGGSIDLVAYSTPKDAYGKIVSAFQKTTAGNGVSVSQSYGASGDQARAVAAGQPSLGAPDLLAGQGRRAAHVPERGHLRGEEGRAHRVPRPQGDDVDRDSGGADEERARQAGREGVLQVPLVGDGAEGVRRPGLPARREGCGQGLPLLQPARSLHDQLEELRAQRLDEGQP